MAKRIFRESKIKGILVILNRIRDKETESYLRAKLRRGGIKPIGTIREDPAITITWLKGTPLEGAETKKDIEGIIDAMEAAEKGDS